MNTRIYLIRLFFAAFVFLGIGSLSQAAETNGYVGGVGNQAAVFSLTWHDDGSVSGSYFCPGGSGRVYALRGTNHRKGELLLTEFTNGKSSATCVLTKSVENGKIVWRGVMYNHDGRNKGMFFYRGK
jgi:hypothetical protein